MDGNGTDSETSAKPLHNIVLVGFMGSGKSTIGRELHQSLGYELIDTDHVIEKQSGKSIPEIFAADGEDAFRSMETDLLQNMLHQQIGHHIISTGGGMVCKEENRLLLRKLGFVVWLSCTPEDIYDRTSKSSNRPLLQCENPMQVITDLLKERSPHYLDASHMEVNTTDLDLNEISVGILESARYYFGSS